MKKLLDAFWRAAAYCLHPRVIALSLLPLLLMAGAALVLGYFFWTPVVTAVHDTLQRWQLLETLLGWLEAMGFTRLRSVLAPLVVVFVATPVIAIVALLVVAALMTPSILSLVAERRFPQLEKKRGGSLAGSLWGTLWATTAALVAIVVSIPLWLVPPLVLVLPPLIWGWLTTQVMAYDALADHASAAERRLLLKRHRGSFLVIGVITGYLGAAPSIVWASGAMFLVLAPVLVPVAIWIYTLVFAFSSLWFTHFALAALAELRAEAPLVIDAEPPAPMPEPVPAPVTPPPLLPHA